MVVVCDIELEYSYPSGSSVAQRGLFSLLSIIVHNRYSDVYGRRNGYPVHIGMLSVI